MVERFEGHAAAHCAIADHGYGTACFTLQSRCAGHTQRGADRGAGVPRTKGVVNTLGAVREGRQAILLLDRSQTRTATGDDLVRIGLMAHVPDDAIVRRVEHVMQRDGQFDRAQAGSKVSALCADRVD